MLEAVGDGPVATRELWRFLLSIDWMDMIEAVLLPVDHPIFLLVARINRLALTMQDALWIRPVDVPAALAARTYPDGTRATLEVTADPQFPENVGTWTVEDGGVARARRRPDVRLDVQALGSAYLGGFTFTQLARAGRLRRQPAAVGSRRRGLPHRHGALVPRDLLTRWQLSALGGRYHLPPGAVSSSGESTSSTSWGSTGSSPVPPN